MGGQFWTGAPQWHSVVDRDNSRHKQRQIFGLLLFVYRNMRWWNRWPTKPSSCSSYWTWLRRFRLTQKAASDISSQKSRCVYWRPLPFFLQYFWRRTNKLEETYVCLCQTADKPYQEAFERELELLKERVRACAQSRMESARRDIEEEERLKRLGPGGLDPAEVYQSLPKVEVHCPTADWYQGDCFKSSYRFSQARVQFKKPGRHCHLFVFRPLSSCRPWNLDYTLQSIDRK